MSATYLVQSILFLPLTNAKNCKSRNLTACIDYDTSNRTQLHFTGIEKLHGFVLCYITQKIGVISAAYLIWSIHFHHRPILKTATPLLGYIVHMLHTTVTVTLPAAYLIQSIHCGHQPILKIAIKPYALALIL